MLFRSKPLPVRAVANQHQTGAAPGIAKLAKGRHRVVEGVELAERAHPAEHEVTEFVESLTQLGRLNTGVEPLRINRHRSHHQSLRLHSEALGLVGNLLRHARNQVGRTQLRRFSPSFDQCPCDRSTQTPAARLPHHGSVEILDYRGMCPPGKRVPRGVEQFVVPPHEGNLAGIQAAKVGSIVDSAQIQTMLCVSDDLSGPLRNSTCEPSGRARATGPGCRIEAFDLCHQPRRGGDHWGSTDAACRPSPPGHSYPQRCCAAPALRVARHCEERRTLQHTPKSSVALMSVRLLDCTLRDGGYYNDWDFTPGLVQRYLDAMNRARVPIVELGFRTTERGGYLGPTAFTTDRYLEGLELPKIGRAHV